MPDSNPKLPWNEEARILAPGEVPAFNFSDEQPRLTRILRYRTEVEEEGSPRGNINFIIYPDGTIKGVWSGEYDRMEDSHCLVMAGSFSGNIDPSKPYIKDNNTDTSMLYFITAGTYTIFERQLSNNRSRNVQGFIYVSGWLYPDYTAVAEIVITEKKRSYETFSWAARPIN